MKTNSEVERDIGETNPGLMMSPSYQIISNPCKQAISGQLAILVGVLQTGLHSGYRLVQPASSDTIIFGWNAMGEPLTARCCPLPTY